MHVELLTEEPSAEAALRVLVPRLLPAVTSWEVRPFTGKGALLSALPTRLRAYPDWLPHVHGPDWCVVVLIDRDDDDCHTLKGELERITAEAGLVSRTANPEAYRVVNRIVVEELEAWFFGDVDALRAAYPFVPASLDQQRGFRDPDDIRGGTWERLEAVLAKAYPTGMPKVEVASSIAPHMDPERNRSASFRAFRDALQSLNALA